MSENRLLSPGTQHLIEAGAGSDHDEAYDQQLQHDLNQPLPGEDFDVAVGQHFQAHDKTARIQSGEDWHVKTRSGGRKPVTKF